MQQSFVGDVDSELFDGPGNVAFNNNFGQRVTFFLEPLEDELASRGGTTYDAEGNPVVVKGAGMLVCKEVEFIEIKTPGDASNIPRRPVTDADRRQYAKQYAAWKAKEAMPQVGMPLSHWPGIRKAEVLELADRGIKTVEELAGVSDGNLASIGLAKRELRDRAIVYLKAAAGNAPLEELQAQLKDRDAQLSALKHQVEALVAAKPAAQPVIKGKV